MAIFCLEYLLSAPFGLKMSVKDVQDQFLKGYYAFHNYAASSWVEHIAVLKRQTLPLDSPSYVRLKSVLTEFLIRTQILSQEQLDEVLAEDDVQISGIIKPCVGERVLRNDWIHLEVQLSRIRNTSEDLFESHFQSPTSPYRELLVEMYGKLQFMCPKIGCIYFTSGLPTREIRDHHLSQHSRSFICTEVHCPYRHFGFDTRAKLERHQTLKHRHPTADGIPNFPRAKRSKRKPQLSKTAARDETETLYELWSKFASGEADLQNQLGLDSRLEQAVEDRHLEICKFLVGKEAIVREASMYSAMSIHDIDDIEIFKYLASVAQAEPQRLFEAGSLISMLAEAIMAGDPEKFKLAPKLARPPWNDPKKLSYPILCTALQQQEEEIASFIIASSDMDPDPPENANIGPLHVAIETGQVKMVAMLLDSGRVDPNRVGGIFDTPLFWAIATQSEQTAQLLITTGRLDLNKAGHQGLTPVAECIVMDQFQIFLALLGGEGMDPNYSGDQIMTALMIAVLYRRSHMIEPLINTDHINLEICGPSGLTALWYALVLDYREIAKSLLNAGAEANDASDRGPFPYRTGLEHHQKTPVILRLNDRLIFAEKVLSTARRLFHSLHSIVWSDRDEWRSAVNVALYESQRSPRLLSGLEEIYETSKFNVSETWSDAQTGEPMAMLSPAEYQTILIQKEMQNKEAQPRELRAAQPSHIESMEHELMGFVQQEQENKQKLRMETPGQGLEARNHQNMDIKTLETKRLQAYQFQAIRVEQLNQKRRQSAPQEKDSTQPIEKDSDASLIQAQQARLVQQAYQARLAAREF